MAGDWTDEQNDAIVADYFAMLADDIARRPYSKAEHNRMLQPTISRPRGSIEYKHQNISAVLKGLGEDWIPGYKPAFNFQASLIDAVVRWLDQNPGWLARAQHLGENPSLSMVREDAILWIGPPPTHSNAPPPDELEQMTAIARRFDVALRDARNRALGRAGEERVLAHERAGLLAAGRTDLADRIRWVSHVDGDGAGYDIQSFDTDGSSRLIEVKTTNGWERTPFHITRNELAVAEAHRRDWRIVRLWNFALTPGAFELRPPLEAHVALMATGYQASFL
jgi:Protein NO VEIN, C-terminal